MFFGLPPIIEPKPLFNGIKPNIIKENFACTKIRNPNTPIEQPHKPLSQPVNEFRPQNPNYKMKNGYPTTHFLVKFFILNSPLVYTACRQNMCNF